MSHTIESCNLKNGWQPLHVNGLRRMASSSWCYWGNITIDRSSIPKTWFGQWLLQDTGETCCSYVWQNKPHQLYQRGKETTFSSNKQIYGETATNKELFPSAIATCSLRSKHLDTKHASSVWSSIPTGFCLEGDTRFMGTCVDDSSRSLHSM